MDDSQILSLSPRKDENVIEYGQRKISFGGLVSMCGGRE